MMQLGFVSAILPEYSLEEVLRAAADIGYDCVEIMCWPPGKAERRYAGVTHIDVTEGGGGAQVQSVGELTERYGVSISALSYYPNMLVEDREAGQRSADHFRKVITAAAELGVGRANGFIGRNPRRSVDDNWPRFREIWEPLLAHADDMDVDIGIENCPMHFGWETWPGGQNLATTPAIWERMFAEFPTARFGLNYDPSHLVWQQMDYLAPIRDFADRIHHVHAKDVRIDRRDLDRHGILTPPKYWHTPKLPGLGDVDWGAFFGELGSIGYRGPVCVEVEDRSYEGSLEDRLRSLRQSHRYLRQFTG
jgi:sugar phosphate isomerase/epimerase